MEVRPLEKINYPFCPRTLSSRARASLRLEADAGHRGRLILFREPTLQDRMRHRRRIATAAGFLAGCIALNRDRHRDLGIFYWGEADEPGEVDRAFFRALLRSAGLGGDPHRE